MFLKKVLPHLLAIGIFLLISTLYFLPQLSGKKVEQGDVIQYYGMAQEADQYRQQTGVLSLWTNAMFGGMPTYQINTIKDGNLLKYVDNTLRLFVDEPIGRFFAAMLCFYILMVSLGSTVWVAVPAAIAFGLTTNTLILYEAGHNTKIRAISFFPLIAAGMLLAFRSRYLWGGVLFALGLGLNVMSNHVQMTYYLFLTLIVFGIARLIYDVKKNQLPHFGKAAGILILGGILAVAASASNLLPTYEYSRDTMRGAPILEPEGNVPSQSSSETEGLAWDYAMQWSNGFVDLFSSVVPGAAGGGSAEPVDDDSAIVQDLQRKGARLPADFAAPLYWGALPFTSGPIYFGAIVFFLAILGLFLLRGPTRWWLALGILLTFMLSLGKNLEWFNRLIFDYFPLYNKFRTPNSVLAVASFLFPLLGFLGLQRALDPQTDRAEVMRGLKWSAGITAGLCVILALLGPSLFDFASDGDGRYVQAGFDLNAIVADRQSLLQGDALRSLLLVILAAGFLWGWLTDKLRFKMLMAGITLLVLIDLWSVGRRYLDAQDFTTPTNYQANFRPRPVDEAILQDPDPNYRVLDVTVNTYNSSMSSYFHKTIGGYHAAKLQRYQDLIDRHLQTGNQGVLNMLNTKYFIIPGQDEQPTYQQNPGALGNAWFVDSLVLVQTPNQEINALNDIDPARTAVVLEREFGDYIAGFDPAPAGSISLSNYLPWELTYQSESSSEQLAVFSEVWYGPDKGWQAYIDGEPVDHIRVNYILRALRVPAGTHEIRFVFDPASYRTGVAISTISSSAILLGFLALAGLSLYRNLGQQPAPPPAAPEQPAGERPAAQARRSNEKRRKKPRK